MTATNTGQPQPQQHSSGNTNETTASQQNAEENNAQW